MQQVALEKQPTENEAVRQALSEKIVNKLVGKDSASKRAVWQEGRACTPIGFLGLGEVVGEPRPPVLKVPNQKQVRMSALTEQGYAKLTCALPSRSTGMCRPLASIPHHSLGLAWVPVDLGSILAHSRGDNADQPLDLDVKILGRMPFQKVCGVVHEQRVRKLFGGFPLEARICRPKWGTDTCRNTSNKPFVPQLALDLLRGSEKIKLNSRGPSRQPCFPPVR